MSKIPQEWLQKHRDLKRITVTSKAQERAWEAYPDYPSWDGGYITQRKLRSLYIKGYEQAEKDIVSLIQSRLNEIIGDAQPRPILRVELQGLIKRIMEEE